MAYAVAFRHPGFWGYLWSVIYILVVDWLLVGFAVASTCRCVFVLALESVTRDDRIYIGHQLCAIIFTSHHFPQHSSLSLFVCSHLANKYMRQYHSHSVEQDVEWLYAFDVHANAFFCSFLLTYVLQV